jgi:hypothetical protein
MDVLDGMARRRRWFGLAAAGVLAAGAGVAWFEPHKLWFDDTVEEARPEPVRPRAIVVGGTDAVADDAVAPDLPALRADLRGIEGHDGTGTAEVVETADGTVLHLDLDFENGPDLRLYLAAAPADGDPDALDDDIVDLGALKGNQGTQNYVLPDDVDLDRHGTVVIWCKRFSVGFGVGALS